MPATAIFRRAALTFPVADSMRSESFPAVADLAERSSRGKLDAHLFAVALAHGMGLSGDEIQSALRDGALLRDPPPSTPVASVGGREAMVERNEQEKSYVKDF